MVDRILNHVATVTTSKIMRVYNKSELFERRKQVMHDWAVMIEREAAARAERLRSGAALQLEMALLA